MKSGIMLCTMLTRGSPFRSILRLTRLVAGEQTLVQLFVDEGQLIRR